VSNSETGGGEVGAGRVYPTIPPGAVGRSNSLSHGEDNPAPGIHQQHLVAEEASSLPGTSRRVHGDEALGPEWENPMGG